MKEGKAVYESGRMSVTVVGKGGCALWMTPPMDDVGESELVTTFTLDDVKDLREIVRMLDNHELTGPNRREREES